MKPTVIIAGKKVEELENLLALSKATLEQKKYELGEIDPSTTTQIARLNFQIKQVPLQASLKKDQKNREISQVETNITAITAAIDSAE